MYKLLLLGIFLGTACCVGFGNCYSYSQLTGWGCKQPTYNVTGTHSSFIGCVKSTDTLLVNQVYYHCGSYFTASKTLLTYPKRGYYRSETITGIWMIDYNGNGQGGYGRIISGGVGYKSVTIELEASVWGGGFNFLIQIYGL